MSRFIRLQTHPRLTSLLGAFLLCLGTGVAQGQSSFDPVNDDTDIFLANPNIETQRPNVLLIIDNTANWSRNVGGQSIFINEQTALVNVINNLGDEFNVGTMLYAETGAGNDNVDGGYVRYAIRRMLGDNKTVLSDMYANLDENGDKSNNAVPSLMMLEAHRYYTGGNSRATHGKVKGDFAGNATHETVTPSDLGEHALPASPTSNTPYNSPIAGACQKSFVIYIGNGPANENSSALSVSQSELASLGYDTSSPIGLTPSGDQGNWFDEWADYMAHADLNGADDGTPHVYTYVVEVDPGTNLSGLENTALMKSAALRGNGEYFAVSSENSGQGITDALNQIFTEVQAVNSVFASTTLPVSVNVRGTNLNQVYIGVFRPDETKSPRWFGNLKMYQLGFDDSTNTLFLADAVGTPAENPATGFINSSSPSFWTEDEAVDFWSYRSDEENGAGGDSDYPDGDLVEKGGAAQQQRIAYAADQSTRNLYTCTGTCTNGSDLSDTPFDTTNSDIDNAALGLGTNAVSTLTAFESQTVEALTDTLAIEALSTAASSIAVTALDNGAALNQQNISSLSTITTRSITNLDNVVTTPVDSISHPTGGGGREIGTVTITGGHNLIDNQVVTIQNASPNTFNEPNVAIDYISATQFSYDGGNDLKFESAANATGGELVGTSLTVTATAPSHGLADGQAVTIAGVSPSGYNGNYNVDVIDGDTFTFTIAGALGPITSFAGATVNYNTTTATATVPGHGYADQSWVQIAGTTPPQYSGTFKITTTGINTFTYDVGAQLATATVPGTVTQGDTTVTATAAGHGFADAQTITITGAAPPPLNGSFTIFNTTATTFQYTTVATAPNIGTSMLASSGTSTTATATATAHGLARFPDADGFTAGHQVELIIEGATGPEAGAYNGTVTATLTDANTFTYPTVDNSAPDPAPGTITARLADETAIATLTGHGYGTAGDTFTVSISGATPGGYNLTDVTATVLDDDTFSYPLVSGDLGDATGTIVSSIKTTNARARVVAHGFADGATVTISGASPGDFNGNFTITLVDDDNFTYTIPSPQGDATGTIVAAAGAGTAGERTDLINWVRGMDNFDNEDEDGSSTDIRASIHGDVLHSRPAVVNYNRHGNDDDVYIYYGSNDGIFRAVKGGFDQSDPGEPDPGNEAWGFIAEEFFGDLQRMRNNEPQISSFNKKPYFADGTIGVLAEDNNGDLKLDITDDDNSDPDIVYLFISMRRGGRFLYALDVSDPQDPALLWKIDNTTAGFAELGYTWSAPFVTRLAANSGDPVLVFGAGYDPFVEDLPPDTIDQFDASGIVDDDLVTYPRSMGRGIFVVDAATGTPIWQAGPVGGEDLSGSHEYLEVTGMNYAIPSDITVISDRDGSLDNRGYVGDTGGNVWRIDMADADPANWTVTKLAALGDASGLPGDESGLRKFLFPPDVVYSDDSDGQYDAVLLGSGDREHPFDEVVQNRFYMLKDPATGTSAIRGTGTTSTDEQSLTENTTPPADSDDPPSLFDATDNCLENIDECQGGETPTTAAEDLSSADGWFITLQTGEKVVGNAVTLNNVTFFNTNVPSSQAGSASCTSDLGEARQYKVLFTDATSLLDQNVDGDITATDRYEVHPGGGYLPSPVPVMVEIDGQTHEGVISGVAVDEPPGSLLNARLRKFWFKEFE